MTCIIVFYALFRQKISLPVSVCKQPVSFMVIILMYSCIYFEIGMNVKCIIWVYNLFACYKVVFVLNDVMNAY
jgi:hypothetical protein